MNLEFYYAKVSILNLLFTEKITTYDLLLHGLSSKKIVEKRNKKFIFGDIESLKVNDNQYIYGKVIKYADIAEETINIEFKKTVEQVVDDKIIAKSHFVIDLKENIVLYTEVKNHINKNSFLEIFLDLLSAGLRDKEAEVELNAINDIYTFFESLNTLSKINYLRLAVYPTNPFPSDIIKEMDDKLKNQKVKRKVISYRAKPEGLIIDDEIKNESIYVDIGYGSGFAEGEDINGQPKKIYSKKSEKQKKTKPISFDNGLSGLLEEIDNLFNNNK